MQGVSIVDRRAEKTFEREADFTPERSDFTPVLHLILWQGVKPEKALKGYKRFLQVGLHLYT